MIKKSFFVVSALMILLVGIVVFSMKNSYSIDTFDNEYNFTSAEKDSNGNYIDTGNIKSAEWTSEDKTTADIKITYNSEEKKILYLGSLCNAHDLSGAKLQAEIDAIAQLGSVDAYFSGLHALGEWEEGLSIYGNAAHRTNFFHINQGESVTVSNLISSNEKVSRGRHANLSDYARWVKEAIYDSNKEYDLIVFSFDGILAPTYMSSTILGELHLVNGKYVQNTQRVKEIEQQMRQVAKILKPYYEAGKVVWLLPENDIIHNRDRFESEDLNKMFIEVATTTANSINENRKHKEDGSYYYDNSPSKYLAASSAGYSVTVVTAYLLYPRNLAEYNHELKSYNEEYTINGDTKQFDITKSITDETGPNMNDLVWSYFSSGDIGYPSSSERKRNFINNYVMSQRPTVWQFALYDPVTYLDVTNEDGSFKEIPSLVGEIDVTNRGNQVASGIYTDSDKQWNLGTKKTNYGDPDQVREFTTNMIQYQNIKITDVVSEGLVPDSFDVEYQNSDDEWISFKHIDLNDGSGNSDTEIVGDIVDLDNNRSFIIKSYSVSKNEDNTHTVTVDILNKNNETGVAIEIKDNIRLVIHVKAGKSFAENTGLVDGLKEYGPKDTNKGDAVVTTTCYKDSDPTNTSSENIDRIERERYKSPKLTKYFQIHYNSDSNGYVTNKGNKVDMNNEDAILGHNPNGSDNNAPFGEVANEGYRLSHWVADKDVTLIDGTVIRKGEPITSEQVRLVNVDDEITFTAIHEKIPAEENEEEDDDNDEEEQEEDDDTDEEEQEDPDIAITGVNTNQKPYWVFMMPVLVGLVFLLIIRRKKVDTLQ